MADAYVYYFAEWKGPFGDNTLSARPATLAAIKGRGEAIMESQIVVDSTELDEHGFLIAGTHGDSLAVNALSAQIRSAELRAASRDRDALKMDDTTEGRDKYMLALESRELRKQALKLTSERAKAIEGELPGMA